MRSRLCIYFADPFFFFFFCIVCFGLTLGVNALQTLFYITLYQRLKKVTHRTVHLLTWLFLTSMFDTTNSGS